MSGTVEARLSTEATGIKPDTTTPITPLEQSVYGITAQFDERTRFISSIDALKHDPAYQAVVAMGEMGIVRILNWTAGRNQPSWLEIAVDEISGQDVTGMRDQDILSQGITLEQIHERAHAWGERENYIGIQDREERFRRAQEVFDLVRNVFFSNQETRDAVTFGLNLGAQKRDSMYRVITAELTMNGQPKRAIYINQGDGVNLLGSKETISVESTDRERAPLELPEIYVGTSTDKYGEVFGGFFEGPQGRGETWEAYRSIKNALTQPLDIKIASVTARAQ